MFFCWRKTGCVTVTQFVVIAADPKCPVNYSSKILRQGIRVSVVGAWVRIESDHVAIKWWLVMSRRWTPSHEQPCLNWVLILLGGLPKPCNNFSSFIFMKGTLFINYPLLQCLDRSQSTHSNLFLRFLLLEMAKRYHSGISSKIPPYLKGTRMSQEFSKWLVNGL